MAPKREKGKQRADDPDEAPVSAVKKPKLAAVCATCGEEGHNARSHHFACGAPCCDDVAHRVHTDECVNLRVCGERGHTTANHFLVCR